MIKKVVNIIKKVVLAFVILYSFNLIVSSIKIYIPINFVSLGIVSFFGVPGLLSLIAMFFIIK